MDTPPTPSTPSSVKMRTTVLVMYCSGRSWDQVKRSTWGPTTRTSTRSMRMELAPSHLPASAHGVSRNHGPDILPLPWVCAHGYMRMRMHAAAWWSGSPPHRISLRLPARLLRLPLNGGVIRAQTGNILYTINQERCRSRLIDVGETGEAVPALCGRDARAPRKLSSHDNHSTLEGEFGSARGVVSHTPGPGTQSTLPAPLDL